MLFCWSFELVLFGHPHVVLLVAAMMTRQLGVEVLLQVLDQDAASLHADAVDPMAGLFHLLIRVPRLVSAGALRSFQLISESKA